MPKGSTMAITAEQLQALVAAGWVKDANHATVEALRRFLESHRPDLLEEQIRKDVEWGLHGAG